MSHADTAPVAIVTGASSGIGRALALALSRAGYRLVLAARNAERLQEVADACRSHAPGVLAHPADVGRKDECRALIEACVAAYGQIDLLINNAGMSMRALFRDTELQVLEQLMAVNFWGAVYCTKFALPYLLERRGSVVGVSSIAGFKGLPGRTGYSASKFALNGFLETLRVENRKTGLHVLIAAPGFTASNIRQTALSADGRAQGESPRAEANMMSAEAVAGHILRAVRRRKPYLVLTREGKLTVWLNKFLPTFMDRMVYNHMAKEPDAPFQ
jgi:short-subunit dehydrogenase